MIIGVSGKKGSGKDTFGNYLVHRYGFKLLKFGTGVVDWLRILNPVVGFDSDSLKSKFIWLRALRKLKRVPRYRDLLVYMDHDEAKRTYSDVRTYLQLIGTEIARDRVSPDYWIKLVENAMKEDADSHYVITDVRFKNEADWIIERGGVLIKLTTDKDDNDPHPSEVGLPDESIFKAIIKNNYDTHFYVNIDDVMNKLGDEYDFS